jgi:predicted  nucleic acid-binding Zn-ribbon protein
MLQTLIERIKAIIANDIEGLSSDLNALNSGAVDFEKMLEEKDSIIDSMTDQIEDMEGEKKDLTRFKHLYEALSDEMQQMEERLKKAEIDIADFNNQVRNLTAENEQLNA